MKKKKTKKSKILSDDYYYDDDYMVQYKSSYQIANLNSDELHRLKKSFGIKIDTESDYQGYQKDYDY